MIYCNNINFKIFPPKRNIIERQYELIDDGFKKLFTILEKKDENYLVCVK